MPADPAWKIVVIDDEDDIREVLSLTLRDAGYKVCCAEDGESGLQLCHRERPQIVITDVRMPKMDGLEVLAALKNDLPDIEVIVATAFGEMELAIRALQLDASDFITKPINDQALHLALDRALTRYRNGRKLKDYAALLEREIENQAQMLHQDKMMSLGRLAASVVHEINNPLSGMLNYLRLMGRVVDRGQPSDDQIKKFKRYLDLIESETARISAIVSNLLTFSRKSTPEFDDVSIADVLARCVMLSQHKLDLSRITLHTRIATDLPTIRGDGNQLQQAVINLIFNAIDAMPQGGQLFIESALSPQRQQIVIRIKDTGTGIADKELPRIFEPFYTSKSEGHGVGLGLSTVFGIMERHGGRVTVGSRLGEGATFSLILPLA